MSDGDWPEDTFTENDVLAALDRRGLKHRNMRRYILIQCPTHEDENPSAQVYKDDWFVNCHATCGRYHITKAFPELREEQKKNHIGAGHKKEERKVMTSVKYKKYDLLEWWEKLPLIPRDHNFKNIPLDVLDSLGWRWDEPKNSYFIPYFTRSKTSLPFGQWRHLSGERRFTFLKDAKPTMYGTWNLDVSNSPMFLVEGSSDGAVLDHVGVPWIAAPSASSSELVKAMATWCKEQGIRIVFAGDNDEAGSKLKEALAEVTHFSTCQPPKKYKDWGDFFVAEGFEKVHDHCMPELGYPKLYSDDEEEEKNDPQVQAVLDIFPGAKVLDVVDSSKRSSKERSPRSYH